MPNSRSRVKDCGEYKYDVTQQLPKASLAEQGGAVVFCISVFKRAPVLKAGMSPF